MKVFAEGVLNNTQAMIEFHYRVKKLVITIY